MTLSDKFVYFEYKALNNQKKGSYVKISFEPALEKPKGKAAGLTSMMFTELFLKKIVFVIF